MMHTVSPIAFLINLVVVNLRELLIEVVKDAWVSLCFSLKLVEVNSSEHSMCCKNRNRRLLITFVIARIWKGLKTNNWKGGKTNFRSSILISNFPSYAGITLWRSVLSVQSHNIFIIFKFLFFPPPLVKGVSVFHYVSNLFNLFLHV